MAAGAAAVGAAKVANVTCLADTGRAANCGAAVAAAGVAAGRTAVAAAGVAAATCLADALAAAAGEATVASAGLQPPPVWLLVSLGQAFTATRS